MRTRHWAVIGSAVAIGMILYTGRGMEYLPVFATHIVGSFIWDKIQKSVKR